MNKIIKKISTPDNLNPGWDSMCECYFQKSEFLTHLHKHNPCGQRYYELYVYGIFTAATIVYTIRMNILTFSNIKSPFKVQLIGIPASVAAPPMIGNPNEFEYFLGELIKTEPGIILGLNFTEDFLKDKVVNLRTLPTIYLKTGGGSFEDYEQSLRHDYRRRLRRISSKFSGTETVTTGCSEFTRNHYELYLNIMKKTTTKLETLPFNAFKYLPSNFELTTYYGNGKMLCWHITCKDKDMMIFFFGGMNYKFRDIYQSYNNNLLGIIKEAIGYNYDMLEFGQTAEIAKTRFGGTLSERRMFFYHRNPVIFLILRILKGLMNYSKTYPQPRVFRNEGNSIINKSYENTLYSAKTIS